MDIAHAWSIVYPGGAYPPPYGLPIITFEIGDIGDSQTCLFARGITCRCVYCSWKC